MRRLFVWLVLAPLATLGVLFAVANRRVVTVSADPFSQVEPAYALDMPLFVIMFTAVIVGVLIGGTTVWFGRLRWKMAANRAERELAQHKAEKAAAEEQARAEAFAAPRPLFPPGDGATG